jgi:hypothetical protein
MPLRLDGLKIAKEIAEMNDGRCLSPTYKNTKTKMEWECREGHTWLATLNDIKYSDSWCPFCSKCRLADGLAASIQIALNRGGRCLSDTYVNNSTRMEWECKCGHVWGAMFRDVSSGKWCKKCALRSMVDKIRIKDGLECAKKIAKDRGGLCLSSVFHKTHDRLEWECQFKHIWHASLHCVKDARSWCPECKNFKTQNRLKHLIQEVLNDLKIISNFRGFDWLVCQSGAKQEIDIWAPELKLAIEYDGEQHFRPVRFGGMLLSDAQKNFKNIQRLDILKNEKIKANPQDVKYFIRFNYTEKKKLTVDYIQKRIEEETGIKIKDIIKGEE